MSAEGKKEKVPLSGERGIFGVGQTSRNQWLIETNAQQASGNAGRSLKEVFVNFFIIFFFVHTFIRLFNKFLVVVIRSTAT